MYLALYRKYRSKTFDEVISQEHITTTLKNQIKSGKPAHAYLFTGSRGTGKTTCAKLMARAVNCLSPVDGSPCGECEICRAIENGCPDVIEMDAASNNGVDDVRALRDEVMYTPVLCRYKVYIIDEVHMMSGSAFNALLKTIEEPPAHVVFILATTELHKVPATIVSRCQQFRFNRIDLNASVKRLCEIARLEGAELEISAAELISKLSDGGMRDAVSLLDQTLSVSRRVTVEVVQNTAGVAGAEHLIALCARVREKDAAGAVKMLNTLHDKSKDLVLLMEDMLAHFRNLCLLRCTDADDSFIPAGSGDINELKKQAEGFTMGEILRCMDILQEYCAKASRARSRKILAEMCFISLCTPSLDTDAAALSLRLEKLEHRVDALSHGAPAAAKPQTGISGKNLSPLPSAPQPAERDINASDKHGAQPPSDNSGALPFDDDEPLPFDIDEPLPQINDGGAAAPPAAKTPAGDTPPEDDPPAEYTPPAANAAVSDNEKPAWLFENGDEAQPAVLPYDEAPMPFDGGHMINEDAPPYDDPPPPYDAPPPDTPPQEDPAPTGGSEMSGEAAEIISRLPVFLQAVLQQVQMKAEGDDIVLCGCKEFHRSFLSNRDHIKRIEDAAKQVTGKARRVVLEQEGQSPEQEKSDHVSDFLKKAEQMGVNIKYKKRK